MTAVEDAPKRGQGTDGKPALADDAAVTVYFVAMATDDTAVVNSGNVTEGVCNSYECNYIIMVGW